MNNPELTVSPDLLAKLAQLADLPTDLEITVPADRVKAAKPGDDLSGKFWVCPGCRTVLGPLPEGTVYREGWKAECDRCKLSFENPGHEQIKKSACVMTCSYPESGLIGLIPAGVVVVACSNRGGGDGFDKAGARKSAADCLRTTAGNEGFSHVFNVRFTEEFDGHPSYQQYKAYAVGDAYTYLS